MRQVFADLWETDTESPFPGLTVHAYLWTRQAGNILFYNSGHRREIEAMAAHGGVAWQFLSHRDEKGDTLALVRERYGATLGVHRAEASCYDDVCPPGLLFERREALPCGVEVIPTPGHSPGSVCFLVPAAQGRRYLFTGDTLYHAGNGTWKAGFIPGVSTENDRGPLADSLRILADLEPDVVFSSAFTGDSGYEILAPGTWPSRVDDALARLLRSADNVV